MTAYLYDVRQYDAPGVTPRQTVSSPTVKLLCLLQLWHIHFSGTCFFFHEKFFFLFLTNNKHTVYEMELQEVLKLGFVTTVITMALFK